MIKKELMGKVLLFFTTENKVTVDQVWQKVCSLMREGRLPHCNGKFQVGFSTESYHGGLNSSLISTFFLSGIFFVILCVNAMVISIGSITSSNCLRNEPLLIHLLLLTALALCNQTARVSKCHLCDFA